MKALLADYDSRLVFCRFLLRKVAEHFNIVANIVFTDEANNGIINFHNNHVCVDKNLRAVVELRYQRQFSLNI